MIYRYRLVTDGKDFAIERRFLGLWFPHYWDLRAYGFWWWPAAPFYQHCWGTRSEVERQLNKMRLNQTIRPVSD